MRIHLASALALTIPLFLASCGGGASTTSQPPSQPSSTPTSSGTAAGMWTGVDSGGRAITGVVLDTGEFWFIQGPYYLEVHGTSVSRGGSFTSTGALDNGTSLTISGSYVEGVSLNGTMTDPTLGNAVTFSATFDNSYLLQPSLSAIAGTYANGSWTLIIDSTGGIVESLSDPVLGVVGAFTGAVVPHQTGNVYGLTLNMPVGCNILGPGCSITDVYKGIAFFGGALVQTGPYSYDFSGPPVLWFNVLDASGVSIISSAAKL